MELVNAMLASLPLLSLLIWLPILGGVLVLAIGDSRPKWLQFSSIAMAAVVFILSVYAASLFNANTSALQLVEQYTWLPVLKVQYALGVDGIALPLILLTTFCSLLVVIGAFSEQRDKNAQYIAAFLMMAGVMNGVFAATDALLFYVFWEAMLIPMFLIIGMWGGPNRIYATIKFFLYTFFGSVFMLLALIYCYRASGSAQISQFYGLNLPLVVQIALFIGFFLAFAVKIPMWPVHTWLPDAHVEAPTGGSVILAAIMLKMGAYGFLRFSLPIAPAASAALAPWVIALSLVAVIYVGLVAIMQKDLKKLIAYSSIAHMGFVTLGLFIAFVIMSHSQDQAAAHLGMMGAMVQVISHGFVSAALFFCVGVVYQRMHTRQIADYGGVVNKMPVFATLMVLFALANSGLPGTSAFVGEFMVVLATIKANFWLAFMAATTLILAPAYTLWMVKRVVFGDIANDQVAALTDVTAREKIILASLAVMVILFGVWPQPMMKMMDASVQHVVQLALA